MGVSVMIAPMLNFLNKSLIFSLNNENTEIFKNNVCWNEKFSYFCSPILRNIVQYCTTF
jgi:hypothetical protein